jgi:DNA repair/transcription protein MET18/MMS19
LKIHVGTTALAMIKNAISTATDCSAYARISMLHFLQLLVNKFGAAKERIENEEGSLVQIMLNRAANSLVTSDELEIQHTYQTLAYFTAACLATGDGAVKDLISQMVSGIGHPVVGRKVAQSFRILLAPSEVMIEQNFCVMRKLRKQRLYHLSVDKIIAMWRESTTKELKNNYLIALAGVFAFMEPKILEDNAEKIFPLILEGTNVDDDHTMHTFILLIRALVIACPEVAATHIDSIINRMTDRTHNTYESPSDASVKCRAAALKVLSLLVSHMERRVVLRRKAKIMVELDVALDDCSRTIRSAAERTKMRWFNLLEADA